MKCISTLDLNIMFRVICSQSFAESYSGAVHGKGDMKPAYHCCCQSTYIVHLGEKAVAPCCYMQPLHSKLVASCCPSKGLNCKDNIQ